MICSPSISQKSKASSMTTPCPRARSLIKLLKLESENSKAAIAGFPSGPLVGSTWQAKEPRELRRIQTIFFSVTTHERLSTWGLRLVSFTWWRGSLGEKGGYCNTVAVIGWRRRKWTIGETPWVPVSWSRRRRQSIVELPIFDFFVDSEARHGWQ